MVPNLCYTDLKETLMECREPGTIRDEELLAYLDGEVVRPVVVQMLEQSATSVRRIIATLLPPPPQVVYQRNSAAAELWPRRYAAEDVSISLYVERGASRRDALKLSGLVTRAGATLETLQGTP